MLTADRVAEHREHSPVSTLLARGRPKRSAPRIVVRCGLQLERISPMHGTLRVAMLTLSTGPQHVRS